MNIRVLAVDDEPLARIGNTTRLSAYSDMLVVGDPRAPAIAMRLEAIPAKPPLPTPSYLPFQVPTGGEIDVRIGGWFDDPPHTAERSLHRDPLRITQASDRKWWHYFVYFDDSSVVKVFPDQPTATLRGSATRVETQSRQTDGSKARWKIPKSHGYPPML